MEEEKDMSFLEHLEAFRWHLIRSVIAILLFAILIFLFPEIIFSKVLLAHLDPDFTTYKITCKLSNLFGMSDALCLKKPPVLLQNISMTGQFYTHITTSIIGGFILSFPYVLWEVWRFIRPALYDKESKFAKGMVFFGSVLFLLGILFGYYIISPVSINFLGSYQVSAMTIGENPILVNKITLTSYIYTVSALTLANGIIFELPMLVYILSKIGIITPEFMRKYRKHALVLALVLSAIITPPDVMSQILVSFPLIILYEIGIKISSRVVKNQVK